MQKQNGTPSIGGASHESASSGPAPNGKPPMFDVAIIGGGPGGTTTGCMLKKYNPALRILIVEKEKFPRDKIGESQLPPIGAVLNEIGAWEKVERAGFPVKIGGTYTWGKTTSPWVFEFVPESQIPDVVERPGAYEGWRRQVAFQVDRSIYDQILIEHAREFGCDAREEVAVEKILHDGDDMVTGLKLSTGETVTARYYIDASGNAAVLRKGMGVKCDVPTALKNVAFWNYWEDPEWANWPDAKATRIHIRSLPFGWIWFIRLGATRTSVGVVCPAEYYKKVGKKPQQFYDEAIALEKEVTAKLAKAKAPKEVVGTTDWSFVVDRTYGKNWFLVGECSGFADPILSAGLTLTQTGARELAYTILELDRGELERDWLLQRYDEVQTRRVRQHMRFAEFWYSANGLFDAVRENCSKIAEESGFKLNAAEAFRWLSFGGLTEDVQGQAGIGGLDLTGVKQVMMRMTEGEMPWKIDQMTNFKLNLANAKEAFVGTLRDGRIHKVRSYTRGNKHIAEVGPQGLVMAALRQHEAADEIMTFLQRHLAKQHSPAHVAAGVNQALQILEVMVQDHWVFCEAKKNRPALRVATPKEGAIIHSDHGEAVIR